MATRRASTGCMSMLLGLYASRVRSLLASHMFKHRSESAVATVHGHVASEVSCGIYLCNNSELHALHELHCATVSQEIARFRASSDQSCHAIRLCSARARSLEASRGPNASVRAVAMMHPRAKFKLLHAARAQHRTIPLWFPKYKKIHCKLSSNAKIAASTSAGCCAPVRLVQPVADALSKISLC